MKWIRRSSERGYADFGWLKSFHTFSFGEYYDARFMGYRDLRVINHDLIAASSGFPMHGHRDMEIITYVLNGAVEHQDSLGNKAQTVAGDVQVMHAGRGIRHSEYNPLADQELELLQIWIQPTEKSLDAGYVQKSYSYEDKRNKLLLVASPDGRDGSLQIHAKARLFAGVIEQGIELIKPMVATLAQSESVGIWIQVAQGSVNVNGEVLQKGDAIALEKEEAARILGVDASSEILLFELW